MAAIAAASLLLTICGPALAGVADLTVNLSSPGQGPVRGPEARFTVAFTSGEDPVARVELLVGDASPARVVDRVDLAPDTVSGSVNLVWATAGFAAGRYTVSARVTTKAGRTATAPVAVDLETTGRATVRIVSPAPDSRVSGPTRVQVEVLEADPADRLTVVLLADERLAGLSNVPPYSFTWNTYELVNGPHRLRARAYAGVETVGASSAVDVMVDNPVGRTTVRTEPTLPPLAVPSGTLDVAHFPRADRVLSSGPTPTDLLTARLADPALITPSELPVPPQPEPVAAGSAAPTPSPAPVRRSLQVPQASLGEGGPPAPQRTLVALAPESNPTAAPPAVTAPAAARSGEQAPSSPARSTTPAIPVAKPAFGGSSLSLPPATKVAMLPERPVAPAATPVAAEPEPAVYVVGTGDNLWTLARRYGCTVSALAAANDLTDPSMLKVGQRLVIPGAPGLFLAGRPVATDVLPLTLNGCLMAPIRAVVEGAGGTVWWHASSREVTARAGDKDLRLTIGRRAAMVSGQVVEMDVAAALRSGRTLVPLRFLDETLGLPVTVSR